MKKLFVISEEERKRILNLHENATKKQYLREQGEVIIKKDEISGTQYDFSKLNPISTEIITINKTTSGAKNVDETKLADSILKLNKDNFNLINTEVTNFYNQIGLPQYAGIDKIIADVMGYNFSDDDDTNRIRDHFKSLGINTDNLGTDNYAFTSTPKVNGKVTNTDKVTKTGWEKFPCVVSKGKPVKLKDGSTAYVIGDVAYYSNGRKITPDGKGVNYNCSSPEFVTKKPRVVPTTEDDLLKGKGYLRLNDKNDLVTKIQKMLKTDGQNIQETGVFDKQTYDAVKNFQTQDKTLKVDGI